MRVHNLVPKARLVEALRPDQRIRAACLSENGVTIVKFLLYIRQDEQAKRFRERIEDKTKNWKFSPDDLKEREYWDEYIAGL